MSPLLAIFFVPFNVLNTCLGISRCCAKNKKKNEEADTSSAINGLNSSDFASEFNDFEHEVAKAKDNFPVDIMVGVRENKAFISDKTYLMGVSVRF